MEKSQKLLPIKGFSKYFVDEKGIVYNESGTQIKAESSGKVRIKGDNGIRVRFVGIELWKAAKLIADRSKESFPNPLRKDQKKKALFIKEDAKAIIVSEENFRLWLTSQGHSATTVQTYVRGLTGRILPFIQENFNNSIDSIYNITSIETLENWREKMIPMPEFKIIDKSNNYRCALQKYINYLKSL